MEASQRRSGPATHITCRGGRKAGNASRPFGIAAITDRWASLCGKSMNSEGAAGITEGDAARQEAVVQEA